MNFLDYVNENTDGLVLIDKLRFTIKDLCHDDIKSEFKDITDDDINKMILLIENAIMECLRDYEEDINTLSLEYVTNTIGGLVGVQHLLNAVDKNRRMTYSEILWDTLIEVITSFDDIDKACEYSNLIKKYYLMDCGEYEGDYSDSLCEIDMQDCLSEIYKYMLKDKIDF